MRLNGSRYFELRSTPRAAGGSQIRFSGLTWRRDRPWDRRFSTGSCLVRAGKNRRSRGLSRSHVKGQELDEVEVQRRSNTNAVSFSSCWPIAGRFGVLSPNGAGYTSPGQRLGNRYSFILKNAAAAHLRRCTKLEMACAIPAHRAPCSWATAAVFRAPNRWPGKTAKN